MNFRSQLIPIALLMVGGAIATYVILGRDRPGETGGVSSPAGPGKHESGRSRGPEKMNTANNQAPAGGESELERVLRESGPAAALAKAKALQGQERESGVKFVLTTAALTDPEFAAREFKASGLSITGQGHVLDALMIGWPDPARALEWADKELTGQLRSSAISTSLARLAKTSPSAAIDFLKNIPPGADRKQAVGSIIATWAAVDPAAAMEYARTSGEPGAFAGAMIDVAPAWVKNDLASAKDYLAQSAGDDKSVYLAHLVAVEEAKKDPAGMLKWASDLQGEAADRARRSAVIAWADADAKAAAAYVDAAGDKDRTQLAPILAGAWASLDPAAAGAWVGKQGSPDVQAAMAMEVAYRWSSVSAEDSWSWASSLPDGPARQQACALLSKLANAPAERRFHVCPEIAARAAADASFFTKTEAVDE
ncbi:hypothetical protein KBB96_08685 [Luteolibacter ambystomatis]|uniref:Uncharacterized protein n=1 Tax=Luteolibacter ambystomatis TaxID=2824561 RepID=A0A975J2T8_9BACT|nr:hypothetical protein [Luteolibacter ambystomatis]QUE52954.1 hypothetical protein KBB96_08685 [Luteolibacter ambystomatis]